MRNKIHQIFGILFSKYGKQYWWPTITKNKSFEIIIGTILTQNTSWKNVEKALIELNKASLVDIEKISKIRRQRLAKLIKSSGYYNQKAERLKIIAEFLKKNKIENLKNKKISELRQILLNVKGIGNETADSIILYAFDRPSFVIDAYTKRIISRIGLMSKDKDYHEFQDLFHKNLDRDVRIFNEYHALLVELAKRHCKTKPVCDGCPLGSICKKKI